MPRSSPPGRRFVSIASLAIVLVLVAVGGAWLFAGSEAPTLGGPFNLVDGEGKPVSDRDFRGRFMLVYFGYTMCPDVCPTTLNQVAEALNKLGARAERVQPVFITLDPERDTPAVLKQYTAAFTPRLVGLTGTSEQVAQVAKEYRVYYAIHRTASGSQDYTVDHSSVLYLMDPNGRFVAPIRADESADQIAADLSRQIS